MIEGEHLLRGIRNTLRTNLSTVAGTVVKSHEKSILIMPDEKVPPMAGEEFIGVYGTQMTNSFVPRSVLSKEVYQVTVGITRRIQTQPVERIGDSIYTEDTDVINRTRPSMLKRAREIITLIDGVWTLMQTVNTAITADDGCWFITPLALISADAQPKYVDEDHFFTKSDSSKFHKGLFIEIVFGGAEFIRPK